MLLWSDAWQMAAKGKIPLCFGEFTADVGGHLFWQGKKGSRVCSEKCKTKDFIVFYLKFNMKSLMLCFVPAGFSPSLLVKYFVKVTSPISVVNFMYLISEGMNALLPVALYAVILVEMNTIYFEGFLVSC